MEQSLEHNHKWIDSDGTHLFHPDCDPRILQDSCDACKQFMIQWFNSIKNIIESGE